MITIAKEIEKDWFLIQLDGTRYYQVWNKWDLFEILLEKGATLWDEDFPMKEEEFMERFKKMKEVRDFEIKLNKQ
jgi:hypothetical protein